MNERVTQADVAKRAGVHVTTVSLALRNHPSLPVATRERLQSLAQEMGYRPDPNLRALMSYRNLKLGGRTPSVLAYITNAGGRWDWKNAPAHLEFFEGASGRAEQLGYTLEHFWLGEPGLSHERLSNILISRGINGVVLASQWAPGCTTLQFDWPHFSGARIDFSPRDSLLHCVTNDQRAIIQLAMRQVRAAGYRRIGFVMPDWWDECVDLAWSAGFLAEQAKLPIGDHIPILYYARAAEASSPPEPTPTTVPKKALEGWLRKFQPEVLISYAPFVLPQLEALGTRIPGDLAFVDIFLRKSDSHTAGVRNNCTRVGEMAVELVDAQLQQNTFGLPKFQTATLVEGTWCDGDTLPIRTPEKRTAASARSR